MGFTKDSHITVVKIFIYFYLGFGLSVSATLSGNTLTVNYNTTEEAMCTCQLGSDATPVSCKTLYAIITDVSFHMGNFFY